MKVAQIDVTSEESQDTQPTVGSALLRVGAAVGTLLGITHDGQVPLITFPGQSGSAAIPARATIDIHSGHVGSDVVLLFENADPTRPIIIGRVTPGGGRATTRPASTIEVEVDGERVIVSAATQLVLKCGDASITLTKAGKVLIQGTYVSSHSSGVNRVKGGSVQLN